MAYLTAREIAEERLDRGDVGEEELRSWLTFDRQTARGPGGTGAVVGYLARWAESWPAGRVVRIIDIGTGFGGLALAIARWAAGAGREVEIVGVEPRLAVLALATEQVGAQPTVRLIHAEVTAVPFPKASFDYAVSGMFLHRLPDLRVMTALKIMDELAVRGVIWHDLTRSPLAYWRAKLRAARCSPIIRHDAPAGVMAGFTRREAMELRDRVGLPHLRFRQHMGGRFTLAGQSRRAGVW